MTDLEALKITVKAEETRVEAMLDEGQGDLPKTAWDERVAICTGKLLALGEVLKMITTLQLAK